MPTAITPTKGQATMAKRLYIGNLSFSTTPDGLKAHLESLGGKTTNVDIISDPYTSRSRGFGFAEFANDAEAQAVINGLNGKELDGRALTINEARPREARSEGGGRGPRGDRRDR